MRLVNLLVSLLAGLSFASAAVDWSVDVGVTNSEVKVDLTDGNDGTTSSRKTGYYLGAGFLRPAVAGSQHHIGMRVQVADAAGDRLMAVRVLDYQYRLAELPFMFGAFAGAASLDTGSTTLGYYGGVEALWRSPVPHLNVGIGAQYGDKLARDKLLADDQPGGQRPDLFYDVSSAVLFLRWDF